VKNPSIETLGIPVKAVTHVVVKVGLNRDGKPQVYSAMAQNAANFILLVVDPEPGAFRQIVPEVDIAGGFVVVQLPEGLEELA